MNEATIYDLREQLFEHEDLRLRAYDDATGKTLKPGMTLKGQLTIGIGRNLTANGITRVEAMYLLAGDIAPAIDDCETFSWFAGLSEMRKRVIVDMRFNLGPSRFRKFRRLIAALRIGDYDAAAQSMRESLWYRQVGRRAVRLVAMMKTDQDPGLPT